MRFLFLAISLSAIALPVSANEIWLKSGSQAETHSTALVQAPQNLGGPEAGNLFRIKYTLNKWDRAHFETDARSLCNTHSLSEYRKKLESWHNSESPKKHALQTLGLDLNAPLVGIEIVFASKDASLSTASGVTLEVVHRFDMRGFTKCTSVRPL